MKIAIIIRRLNVRGGTQRQALSLARELLQRGDQISVYALHYDPALSYPELSAGIQIKSLNPKRRFRFFLLRLWEENQWCRQLAGQIDSDTDILNPHDQFAYQAAAYFKRHIRQIPSVWMMNDPPTRFWFYERERAFNPSLKRSWLAGLLYRILDRYDFWRNIRLQDQIVVLDFKDQQWIRKMSGKKAVVIRGGMNLEYTSIRRDLERPAARVLAVGIPFPYRRLEDAIEAMGILRDKGHYLSLVIVGDTSADEHYCNNLRKLIQARGLDEVIFFAGRVDDKELREQYENADFFVFPSDQQSYGLVVFEAMAAGLPSIVSKGAGAHEILKDGENALLVNPAKPWEIARALERLLLDPELRRRISLNARNFCLAEMSWARYAGEMRALFERALKNSSI